MSRADLSQYTIVVSNERQNADHARTCAVHWGLGQSFEDYLDSREKELGCDWGKDGALIYWALVKRDDLEGEIYAGCRTYRRKGMLKEARNGGVEDVWIYGIASVVTPPQHFRNGFATHLLRLLHYHLADPAYLPTFPSEWGAPPPALPASVASALPHAIGSILWSDVGSTFYSKCTIGVEKPGWIVKDEQCTELTWTIDPSSQPSTDAWEVLYPSDLPDIGAEIALAKRAVLEASTKGETGVQYLQSPDAQGLLAFNLTRALAILKQPPAVMPPCGARLRVNPSDTKQDVIVLFTAHNESIEKRLLIQLLHNFGPQHLDSLLRFLDPIASEAGWDKGWIWGLGIHSDLVEAWKQLPGRDAEIKKRAEKDGHLLGAAWYGPQDQRGELTNYEMWNWC